MRRALVLAAGGVTGALYEVLKALEEEVGPPGELFDLFLGVSAGASGRVAWDDDSSSRKSPEALA
jgi:hypothetical protein